MAESDWVQETEADVFVPVLAIPVDLPVPGVVTRGRGALAAPKVGLAERSTARASSA